jgi:NhaP-type Na+/H+ or K+/H+ antiporter
VYENLALLATMLAPTNAALFKAVVSNAAVPDEIRQGLNVESGLNDGICVPVLFVFLALAGSGIDTEGKLSIGWFGPRGLASIVFGVIVVNSGLPNTGPLAITVVCTIILSIVFHGITANPWARAYGERRRLAQQDAARD